MISSQAHRGIRRSRHDVPPMSTFRAFPALLLPLLALCLAPSRAFAAVVISEVHWAGSDLSTSDEWVEIVNSDQTGTTAASMSGWVLTSVTSAGAEATIFRFPAHTRIEPGQFFVISHFGVAQSRLLSEPAFVAPSMSLPNTRLLLRLRDASGNVLDQVDDGVGEPFAGTNVGSPLQKSSMERADLSRSGTESANWITSTASLGWDEDVSGMRGTPGYPRQEATASATSSATASSASANVTASSSSHSSSSATCPAWDPVISIQSGAATGEEKVTLNVQILNRFGSLGSASCSVDFGDGSLSASCNPPSHTYDRIGSYTIRAEVRNTCAETAIRSLAVEVAAKAAQNSSPTSGSESRDDNTADDDAGFGDFFLSGSKDFPFLITGVLPNPEGKDAGKELIEIANVSLGTASLEGWSLRLPHAKKSKYTFGNIGFSLRETKRFLAQELGMTLGNDTGELSLLDPRGQVASTLSWKTARDGVFIRASRALQGNAVARVTNVVDGDTIDVEILQAQGSGFGRTERVRMIGIDAPENHATDPRQRMLSKRSTEFVRSLLDGVTVTLVPGTEARDIYGRLLAYIDTPDGDLVQEMILREGLASVYLRFAFAKEAEFIGYQREAQEAGMGLWGVAGPQNSVTNTLPLSAPVPLMASVLSPHAVSSSAPSSGSSSSALPTVFHISKAPRSATVTPRAVTSRSANPVPPSRADDSTLFAMADAEETSTHSLDGELLAFAELTESGEVLPADSLWNDFPVEYTEEVAEKMEEGSESASFLFVWVAVGGVVLVALGAGAGWGFATHGHRTL